MALPDQMVFVFCSHLGLTSMPPGLPGPSSGHAALSSSVGELLNGYMFMKSETCY